MNAGFGMAKLYCTYCRTNKPKGTKFFRVRDRRTKRLINRKCVDCRNLSLMPPAERDARGKKHSEVRKASSTRRQQELRKNAEQQALNRRREEKT